MSHATIIYKVSWSLRIWKECFPCAHMKCANCLCVPFVSLTVVSGIATAEWKLSAHSNCAYITNILLTKWCGEGDIKKGYSVPGDLLFFLNVVFISSLVWSLLRFGFSLVSLVHLVQISMETMEREIQRIETHPANVLLSQVALVAF